MTPRTIGAVARMVVFAWWWVLTGDAKATTRAAPHGGQVDTKKSHGPRRSLAPVGTLDSRIELTDPRTSTQKLGLGVPPRIPPNGSCWSYCSMQREEGQLVRPPQVVRCPHGWKAVGPHCVGVLRIPPFTECPDYHSRFHAGPTAELQPVRHGVCQTLRHSGASIECPEGYYLDDTPPLRASDALVSIRCVREEHFIPQPFLAQQSCPLGYVPVATGCVSKRQELPPGVTCKNRYSQLATKPVSVYTSKKLLECTEAIQRKGRLWCPEGFILHNEPFANYTFGETIPLGLAPRYWSNGIDALTLKITQEFTSTPRSSFRTECIQLVAVHYKHCNEHRCVSPLLTAATKILKDWSYLRLYSDPIEVLHHSIPSGNDLRTTIPAYQRSYS